MNRKNTKRALCMSFVSLLLCCSMLVGSTFAWFTDTASTAVNKIQAGTLDIVLEMKDAEGNWVDAENQTLNFKKAAGHENESILWEPGCTYVLPELRVRNEGNLHLKYMIAITGIKGDALLNNAIEWTISDKAMDLAELGEYKDLAPKGNDGDTSAALTIQGHMREDAGNEYQGLSIDGIGITVFATQLNQENDSFGPNYDLNAPELEDEDGNIVIDNVGALFAFANKVNSGETYEGKTVLLGADIDLAGYDWTPIGNVDDFPSVTFKGTFNGQGHTIRNMRAVAVPSTGEATAGLFGSSLGTIQNVIVDNATVVSDHYAGGIVGYTYGTVDNCIVQNSTIISNVQLMSSGQYDNGDKVGGIVGYLSKQGATGVVSSCTVKNTTINAYRDLGGVVGYADKETTVTSNTVTDVTLVIDKDPAHNYKGYTQDADHDLGQVVGEVVAGATVENNIATNVTESEKYVIKTAAELKEILTMAGSAGSGDGIIELTADVDLSGESWTPVTIDGYNGAGVVTIKGNGHTISGLTDTLLAGGFAGNSGVIINDLTIANANITSSNSQGYGAFINCVDSMPKIELHNCHLVNSTITDTLGARVGGLIGWSAGYNKQDDGPVDTYITINGCSVTNCTITAAGSVGAIIGHAGSNPATYHTITNCTVKSCALTSNDDSYRVGAIVGTANVGEVTITGCTSDGNTMLQNNAGTVIARPDGQSELYGRFVPGTTGKLTIDGVAIN